MLAIWGKAKREGKKPAAEKMTGTVVVDVAQKVTGREDCLGFESPQANLENIHTHR